MRKLLKLTIFASLLLGGLVGCDDEKKTNTNPDDNKTDIVVEKTLSGITLNTDSVKKTYTYGEGLNLSGLEVTASYSDNSTAKVNNYTTSPANGETLNSVGDVYVVVMYENKTATFAVTVNKALTGITLDTTNVKKDYVYGDALDITGLVVTANFNDNSSETVTNYTVEPNVGTIFTNGGDSTIKVSYGGFDQRYSVMVDKSATAISIDTTNVKTNYHYGEKFDSTGLEVNVVYANGKTGPLDGYSLSIAEGTELTTVGSQEVIVSFGDYTKKYEFNVEAGLAFIDASEVKTSYKYGETLDYTGLKVGYRYSDGSVEYTEDYKMGTEEGRVFDYVGNWNIHVYLTDHNKVAQDFSFTITAEGVQETGTSISIDLADDYWFNDEGGANFTVRPTPSSNFAAYMKMFRGSGKKDSMSIVNGNQRRFYANDFAENRESLSGITSIAVHGGNGNYKLYVGYTKDNMGSFLTPQITGDTYNYYQIPKANYFKIRDLRL